VSVRNIDICGRIPAMGFSTRITETETGNNLFPQWCPLRNREQKQKQPMGLVAPRGRWMPNFLKKNWDVVAHWRACLLGFWINFPGFRRLKKRVFRRRSVGNLTNLRSGSQIFDKYMCHVCHDVCGVCGEDWQVGHSENKSNWRSELTHYSSCFSSLSSALSIPNSNCSSATCE